MLKLIKATTKDERDAINTFLNRHNQRGYGSRTGYIAYYAAITNIDDLPLIDRIRCAAKICPLHTPQAARFFAGPYWRHVYNVQRLAAIRTEYNDLSRFVGFCLREIGNDPKVWFVCSYADTGIFDSRTGLPHNGGIYRATNAIYAGLSTPGGIEGYIHNGQRFSMRKGPKTLRKAEIPAGSRILRKTAKHRYVWAVGPPIKRSVRRLWLMRRFHTLKFVPAVQPMLLMENLYALGRSLVQRAATYANLGHNR